MNEHNKFKNYKERKKFYKSATWRDFRLKALTRDNWECVWCKEEGKTTVDSIKEEGKKKKIILNVDHIKPIEEHPELALVLDNLQTLCIYHHNVKEGRVFKREITKWDKDEKW